MTDQELERLRAEVASADREILALVNRRLELVREIRAHKERHGRVFLDQAQEQRLLERLREANAGRSRTTVSSGCSGRSSRS